MITTEELDALDALANTPEIAAFDGVGGVLSSLPRLLSAAREAETLRAKLAESETWRTELRAEMDAVTGKLREVTAQRDAAVRALHEIEERTDATHAVCPSCGAARGCDEEGEECVDGQCNGDHPCNPGCALSAAREEATGIPDDSPVGMDAALAIMEGRWPEFTWHIDGEYVRCKEGWVIRPERAGELWQASRSIDATHSAGGDAVGPRAAFSQASARALERGAMSEITKACETCNDTRKVSSDAWEAPPAPCPDCERTKACETCEGRGELSVFGAGATWEKPGGVCSGTGRAPDIEATLRAEIALLKDVAGAAHGLIIALRGSAPDDLAVAERAVVIALNATGPLGIGIVRAQSTPERIAELLVESERIKAQRRSMERRITQQARELTHANTVLHAKNLALDALHYVWCSGCNSSHRHGGEKLTTEQVEAGVLAMNRIIEGHNNDQFRLMGVATTATYHARLSEGDAAKAEVARLTATLAERDGEIARLEGRERGAANMLRDGQWNGRGAFWHGPCCPNCGGTERTGHYANCARAAWLAGCKS